MFGQGLGHTDTALGIMYTSDPGGVRYTRASLEVSEIVMTLFLLALYNTFNICCGLAVVCYHESAEIYKVFPLQKHI